MKKRITNQLNLNWRKPLDKSGIGFGAKNEENTIKTSHEIGSCSHTYKNAYSESSIHSHKFKNKDVTTTCHYCMKKGHYISKCKIRWEHFYETNPKGPKLVWVPKTN